MTTRRSESLARIHVDEEDPTQKDQHPRISNQIKGLVARLMIAFLLVPRGVRNALLAVLLSYGYKTPPSVANFIPSRFFHISSSYNSQCMKNPLVLRDQSSTAAVAQNARNAQQGLLGYVFFF